MSNNGFPGLPERPRLNGNNTPNVPIFSNPVQASGVFHNTQQPQDNKHSQKYPLPHSVNNSFLTSNMYQQKPVKSNKTATVLAVVFGVLFGVTLVGGFSVVGLNQTEVLEKQREVERLEKQNKNLEQDNFELKTNLDHKETFGQLSLSYVKKLESFNGLPVKDQINKHVTRYNNLVQEAYQYREDSYMMENIIGDAQNELNGLEKLRVKYENERNSNATGTVYENGTDVLSGGVATVVWYSNGANKCGESEGSDAAACVWSSNPNVVYVNTDQFNRLGSEAGTGFRDYYYNGVVWHEFAHVIQFTNNETTSNYLGYFDNDKEKMADCYANAFYSLDFSSYAYNLGCNNDQLTKVQEWADSVKFVSSGFKQQ